MSRRLLAALALTVLAAGCGGGAPQEGGPGEHTTFDELERQAQGAEVTLHMWGGDDAVNAYVDDYVAPALDERYDLTLRRVPVSDAADSVNKLLTEKLAGRDAGSIDLIWVNGENFATGADADLWWGPWAEDLPNARYIDWDSPDISTDFGYPVEGREAPWGKTQLVFVADTAKVPDPPRSMAELAVWAEQNPGRFTYPAPPDFTGNAFLVQAAYAAADDSEMFQEKFGQAAYDRIESEVMRFLGKLDPHLWREGGTYPPSLARLDELYAGGEVWMTMNYNPQAAQRLVDQGVWPDTTRTFVLNEGTLNNTHYLAIPFNAPNTAGAQVVANFLQSPEAQLEKQDPAGWGDLTTLDLDRLPGKVQRQFSRPAGPAVLPTEVLQDHRVPEARAGWLLALQESWKASVLRR